MGLFDDEEREPAAESKPAPAESGRGKDSVVVKEIRIEGVFSDGDGRASLMSVTLSGSGLTPAGVIRWAYGQDAGVKLRTEFPSKGAPRELKTATVIVVSVKSGETGKSVDLTCTSADGDLMVRYGRKQVETFLPGLKGLGVWPAEKLAELEEVMAGKGSKTMILNASQYFGVKYWKGDDGSAWADSVIGLQPTSPQSSVLSPQT